MANEFMQSGIGKSVLQAQVKGFIDHTSSGMHDRYTQNKASLEAGSHERIQSADEAGQDRVRKKTEYYHLNMLSAHALTQGTDLKMEAARENLPQAYDLQKQNTEYGLNKQQSALRENHALRKQNFEKGKED